MLFNLLLVLGNKQAQEQINVLTKWCDENEVIINTGKSRCLHSSKDNKTSYHFGNTSLPEALSFADLGVIRSADRSYALHADYART